MPGPEVEDAAVPPLPQTAGAEALARAPGRFEHHHVRWGNPEGLVVELLPRDLKVADPPRDRVPRRLHRDLPRRVIDADAAEGAGVLRQPLDRLRAPRGRQPTG